jgi:hypothetical protein
MTSKKWFFDTSLHHELSRLVAAWPDDPNRRCAGEAERLLYCVGKACRLE